MDRRSLECDPLNMNRRGYSLIELIIALAAMAIVSISITAFVTHSANMQGKMAVQRSINSIKREIISTLSNRASLVATVKNATNTSMACLLTATCTSTSGGGFNVYNSKNALVYNSLTSTAGFTIDGGPCSTYSTSNNACPLRFGLTWSAVCSSASDCKRPRLRISAALADPMRKAAHWTTTSFNFIANHMNPCTGGRVFYDGFESGDTNLWEQDGTRNRCTVVSTAVDSVLGPYKGTRMASCNSNGTMAYAHPAAFETLGLEAAIKYDRELFFRGRFRIDSDFDRTNGVSQSEIFKVFYWSATPALNNQISNVINTDVWTKNLVNTNNTNYIYWGGATGDNTGTSTAWHSIEYYINTTGSIKVWNDGVLVHNLSAIDNDNSPWLPFYLVSSWGDSHDAANHLYFDEMEVYTDTGCESSSGSMSDASIISTE